MVVMDLVGDLINELYQSPVGIAGAAVTAAGYVLYTYDKIKTNTYNWMNFVGTGLLAAYAVEINSPIFAVGNGIWSGLALYRIVDAKIHFGNFHRSD